MQRRDAIERFVAGAFFSQSLRSVATWSLRERPVCSLPASGADQFVELRLDVRMDVFVIAARRRLDAHQRADDRVDLVVGQHAGTRQRARPGDRAFHVVGEQLAVERERVVERRSKRRRLAARSARPTTSASTRRLPQPRGRHFIGGQRVVILRREMRLRPRSWQAEERMKPAESRDVVAGHVEVARSSLVERVRRRAADDRRVAFVELQRDRAADLLRERVDERVERFLERREPLAVVDELRVARGDALLLVRAVAVERDRFERLERGDEQRAARRLVHAARLDADQPVLDDVGAADAVASADLVQRRSRAPPARASRR